MKDIQHALGERVLILDGAMGTMIQQLGLNERDFRGERFVGHGCNLAGCNDVLVLTRPDAIAGIHRQYLDAGADIITTNSFNANALSLAQYGLSDSVVDINRAAAMVARREADRVSTPEKPRFVAGDMGPCGVALSMGQDEVDFDTMARAYEQQAAALLEGGVDLLLLETVFDPINCKAAIAGISDAMRHTSIEVPLMISATLTESGRLLSGQTLEAFLIAVSHANPLIVGINCGFGVELLLPWLDTLDSTPYYVSMHANAGLPDALGHYNESPDMMARALAQVLAEGKLNIVGGCCGTTPAHIAAIAALTASPHIPSVAKRRLMLSGMEPMAEVDFIKVGERCNVAGSRKFLRLISEGNISEACSIARSQVEAGATVIDVNMDDGLLDTTVEMNRFIDALSLDATAASVPLMVDSSNFDVITSALKHIQGRPIVNSISLKEGEDSFLSHAREIKRLGGAVVVMAFDERGQATTRDRKIEICARAYRLLTECVGFRPEDIVFDPNVLTIATGMEEHDRYALDFIEATEWIHDNLPGAGVSGGVSNLSFAFRGNDPLRRDMHTIFIDEARRRGMTMAILNPSTPLDVSQIDKEAHRVISDAIMRPSSAASLALTDYAMAHRPEKKSSVSAQASTDEANKLSLADCVYKGITDNIENLVSEALEADGSAMSVINTRLMPGMNRVGDDFASGRMFLPQVVRSASVMKRAFDLLAPAMEAEKSAGVTSASRRIVLATVKGDVHDIGKNIVAAVMRCSGFDVIDLGVMVPAETIIDTAVDRHADCIGLSGLITPSLAEMAHVAEMMEARGLDIPLFVGGATTSELHTALKIAPVYSGVVAHSTDAASLPALASSLTGNDDITETVNKIREEQQRLRDGFTGAASTPTRAARLTEGSAPTPKSPGVHDFFISPGDVMDLINWRQFLATWKLNPALADTPAHCPDCMTDDRRQASSLIAEARAAIEHLADAGCRIHARVDIVAAHRQGDDIVLNNGEMTIATLRAGLTPDGAPGMALADFVAEVDDTIALFTVTVGKEIAAEIDKAQKGGDDWRALLIQSVADRLVEAATEWTHRRIASTEWGFSDDVMNKGIRPAVGYPSLPDQSLAIDFGNMLGVKDMGITVTENGALYPQATTMGVIIASPQASYFAVGRVDDDTLVDYSRRRGIDPATLRRFIP